MLCDDAHRSLSAGDVVAAANLYRLSAHYATDAASRAAAEAGLKETKQRLADVHMKKGRSDEKEQRWTEAAVSYGKAHEARPDDPEVCDALANALLEEGTDLERAARVAETAVARAPRRAPYRVTLALVLMQRGARDEALKHAERALELSPDDAHVQKLVRALRRVRG